MPLSAEIQEFTKCCGNTWNLDVNAACELFFENQHAEREKRYVCESTAKAVISVEPTRGIARFFASHGMVGVFATYHLLSQARFPDGMQDTSLAVRWLAENIGQDGGDLRSIFLIGQSAGGAHLSMALWSGLLGHSGTSRRYTSERTVLEILSRSAGAMFRAAAVKGPSEVFDVPVYVSVGELDPAEIVRVI
ncbi:Alpha/Beta hydrolase protein [Aspergillus spectabilis]